MAISFFEHYIRKIWLKLFTQKPYKIIPYDSLYKRRSSEKLSVPEKLNFKLIEEVGGIIYYPPLIEDKEQKIFHKKIDNRNRYLISGFFKEPNRIAYSVSDVCIVGPLGLVYDCSKRSYIAESAKEWLIDLKLSPYTNIIHFPEKKYLKGVVISCLTNDATAGFYHFIFESIVKIDFLKSIALKANFLLFNGPSTNWKIKWLIRAGVDINKIIWVDNGEHFECEQLIFSSRLIKDQEISLWCIKSLKRLFDLPTPAKSDVNQKVIFISRNEYVRHIQWENFIKVRYPFIEFVSLTNLDIKKTIALFQSATHVIGPHGAGLSNIFMCQKKTKLLEIFPLGKTYQPCYYRLATVCDISYSTLYLDFENFNNKDAGIQLFNDNMQAFLSDQGNSSYPLTL